MTADCRIVSEKDKKIKRTQPSQNPGLSLVYPMNAFVLSDGRVQLIDSVKSNQQNYCLQIKYTYHNNDGSPDLAIPRPGRRKPFSTHKPAGSKIDKCIYTTKNSLSADEGLASFTKAIEEMPGSFGGLLQHIISDMGLSHEDVEAISGISVRTLTRMIGEPDYTPQLKSVITLCVALHLFPLFSLELIARAGYSIDSRASATHKMYKYIINVCYDAGIESCNMVLKSRMLEPLTVGEILKLEDL